VAAGHPGWSTRRQLECARHLVPAVKPDLIIWGYVTNDPDEKIIPQIFDAQDQPPYGQRIRRQLQRLIPNLAFKFEMLRAQKLANQYTGPEYGYAYPDWELKLLEGENFERYKETIREVGQFVEQSKTPTFLLTLPHFPGREYFEPRYAPVLKEWQAAGIAANNTLDAFIARYGNVAATGPEAIRWGINPADSHPGPKATHFYAVMAADYIEAHWPQLLGSKDASRPPELAINDWLPYDMLVEPRDPQTFDVIYPATTEHMPRLALEEPSVLLALRYPLPINEIRLDGEGLQKARLWISTLAADDYYDEDRWHDLGEFTGPLLICKLPEELARKGLTKVRLRADVHNSQRIKITFDRGDDARERP